MAVSRPDLTSRPDHQPPPPLRAQPRWYSESYRADRAFSAGVAMHRFSLPIPSSGRADGGAAEVVGAGAALGEALAFEAAQHGGQVGALQPGAGGDLVWWRTRMFLQVAHDHALGLRERDGVGIVVAVELDLPRDDQDQVG